MSSRNLVRKPIRVVASFLAALALLGLSLLIGAQVAAALAQPVVPDVTGQFSDSLLTSGDLGVATDLVSDATVIRTPDATLAGADGVAAYIDSLRNAYPGAEFSVTGFTTAGSLIIVDWQGTAAGEVLMPGRTLITVEDGMIAELVFLSLGSVAPAAGASAASDSAPALNFVIVDEQGMAFVAEQASASVDAAMIDTSTWEDLDPNTVAERRAMPLSVADSDPAHPCIPCDIS